MGQCRYDFLMVADADMNFIGYLERKKIFGRQVNASLPVIEMLSANARFVYEEQDAGSVAEIMGATNMDVIAVLSDKERNRVTGMITSADIVNAYSDKRSREKKPLRHLSVTRRTLRLIIKGRTLIQSNTKKFNSH